MVCARTYLVSNGGAEQSLRLASGVLVRFGCQHLRTVKRKRYVLQSLANMLVRVPTILGQQRVCVGGSG